MKTALPWCMALLVACGDPATALLAPGDEPTDPTADTAAVAQALTEAIIDCGAVIPRVGGEYVLSEIAQLEAIDSSGCNYLGGSLRVAFTVPLVPSAQRHLFSPPKLKHITGRILQGSSWGGGSTQWVHFVGLEQVGAIELHKGQACVYPVLTTAGRIAMDEALDCSFPALRSVSELQIDKASEISGFNALTSVQSLRISSDKLKLSGFRALTQAGGIKLSSSKLASKNWTGSLPALTQLDELDAERLDFFTFKLPKLSRVTGRASVRSSQYTALGLKSLVTVGGSLSVHEDASSPDILYEGPAALERVDGSMDLSVNGGWLNGYKGLKSVGGMLTVSVGGAYPSLDAFAKLETTGGLHIQGSPYEVRGFDKLTTINGPLWINHIDGVTARGGSYVLPALTEVKGSVDLQLGCNAGESFPKLRTIGGSLRHDRWKGGRCRYSMTAGLPALEQVGGELTAYNISDGYNALVRVGGTLSILSLTGSLNVTLPGFRKVTTVSGDLVLDKDITTHGPDSSQRLLDQLVGFTGRVILM